MLGSRVTQEKHNAIICLCSWFMYIIGFMKIEDLIHNYEFRELLNTEGIVNITMKEAFSSI